MTDDEEAIEEQLRALLPRAWVLQSIDAAEDERADWGDLDAASIAAAKASMAEMRFIYGWEIPGSGGGGALGGPDRLSAVRAAYAHLRAGLVRPGEPGAFAARVEVEPLELVGLPDEAAGIDVSSDGRWAATGEGGRSWLATSTGVRRRIGGRWTRVAWMGEDLVTDELARRVSRVTVRDRHGDPTASWSCPWSIVVGPDWIAAPDSGDDPNEDVLRRLVIWNADGTTRREWRPPRTLEDAAVLSVPGGGLGLLGNTWSDDGWLMHLFHDIDSAPRTIGVPSMWGDLYLDGPHPVALGSDAFALIRRDLIWAWRAGDIAMTLIHEGPLVIDDNAVDDSARYHWLNDGRVLIRHADRWWLLRIVTGPR